MKILGSTGQGVLVEVSPKELVQMTGIERFMFSSMSRQRGYGSESVIGNEYTLTDIYDRVRELNANEDNLAKARKMLRAIADVLEPLDVEVPLPTLEDATE